MVKQYIRLSKITNPENRQGYMVEKLVSCYWTSIGCILDNGTDGDQRRRYFLSIDRDCSYHRTLDGAMVKCGATYIEA